ncbi:MAG: hexuronate transporter [Pirellulaceae bacterium]|nr:MAG: hexuronate transporter [Pirellulaceae bacterium]
MGWSQRSPEGYDMTTSDTNSAVSVRPPAAVKWWLCGLLLLATMLNYMDRQTLSLTITDISRELGLSNEQYGRLEAGFGFAFAAGGLVVGFLVDRIPVRFMYPAVLIGWSVAGLLTAYCVQVGGALVALGEAVNAITSAGQWSLSERAYLGLMVCRVALGFFEAGHWPCALVTTQRILRREERPLGNSLLQSGAAIGAIFTPLVVQALVSDQPGSWRGPFVVIGIAGMAWVVPWLLVARPAYVARRSALAAQVEEQKSSEPPETVDLAVLVRRFVALMIVVVMINLTWQFFRVWLPKFLREYHTYDRTTVNFFTSAYYIATDAGCLSIGFLTRWMAARGWRVHSARMATFAGCTALTTLALGTAVLPRGPLLLGLFLLIGFGALGLFPNYYSFTQELSMHHQGKVTGVLGATTWITTSIFQIYVGRYVDQTQSYALGIALAGLAPLVALVALLVLWPSRTKPKTAPTGL